MTAAYIACLAFGLLLALVSAVAGADHGDGGAHVEAGGDVEVSGGAHAHHGAHHGGVSFPYFSPAVIGSFFAAFGAGGLIASEGLGATSLGAHLGAALGAGVGLAALAGLVIMRVVRAAESTSQLAEHSLVDAEGEVLTEIPAGGIGEVAVDAGGTRMTFPARSEDGKAIPHLAHVQVTRVVGGTVYVRPHIEERLRGLRSPDESNEAGGS